jgi:RNA polymerase sigma factor (sigma-70 family)
VSRADDGKPHILVRKQVRRDMGSVRPNIAQRILFEYRRTIEEALRRYSRVATVLRWVDVDDLRSIAQVAAIEAFLIFDDTRGVKLGTWIQRVVRSRLHDTVTRLLDPAQSLGSLRRAGDEEGLAHELEHVRNFTQPVSIDLPPGEQHGARHLSTGGPSPEEIVGGKQEVDALHDAIRQLELSQVQVVHAELDDVNGATLARQLGVTRQRVNVQRRAALTKLRTTLSGG